MRKHVYRRQHEGLLSRQREKIGNKMGGMTAKTFAHLPRGWSVLYQLALLPAATLEQYIQKGRVHPDLTLQQTKKLVAEFQGRSPSFDLNLKPL